MKVDTVNPDTVTVSEVNERQSEPDQDAIDTLEESASEVGIVQPVLVREIDDEEYDYAVIIGQRRTLAAQQAGLDELPAVIVDWDDEQSIVASISENVDDFNETVSTRDRAAALAELWEQMDGEGRPDATKLSERLGVDRQKVYRWLEPLREEWEGTDVDPTSEPSSDEDSDDESDESDDDEDGADDGGKPDDRDEFSDDPIDEVGEIDADADRDPEETDGDYDGPDTVTEGADSENAPKSAPSTMEDPEEAETEVPEPDDDEQAHDPDEAADDEDQSELGDVADVTDNRDGDDSDDDGGEEDESEAEDSGFESVLPTELADMSVEKISAVRRMTGGGDEGVRVLREAKEKGLSSQKLREASKRVQNGADVDAALDAVHDPDDDMSGPRLNVSVTWKGEVAEAIEEEAKARETSPKQVVDEVVKAEFGDD